VSTVARELRPPAVIGSRRLAGTAGVVAVLLLLFLAPSYLGSGSIVLAFTLLNAMTMAQAWNLIGGFGGQFSLAHGLFVGAGSYTTAVLLVRTGVPLWLAVPFGGCMAAVIAALAALPLLRLRGVYFAVGSLGVAVAALAWMINWDFTNQTSSYSLPASAFLGFETQYYMAAALALTTTVCVAIAMRTRFGLRLMAVRDDEDAALELGVNSFVVKLAALTLSAFLVGVAGALIAVQKGTLEPYSAFSLNFTIDMIIASVIGGLGTVVGPLIGASVMFALQQWLEDYSDWSTLILGIALIVIIRVAPGGIWGLARLGAERLLAAPAVERGLRAVGVRAWRA
jgi:branched-chain amino acid transport system permease protein